MAPARRGIALRAAAAVFVARGQAAPAPHLAAFAAQFGLTSAEARLLGLLIGGATPADAAAMLHIAETTAKAHLARLFAKTGTGRHAELIGLVLRLTPPARDTH